MDKNFVSVDKEGIAVIKRFPVNFHEIYLENVQQSTYDQILVARNRIKSMIFIQFPVSLPSLRSHMKENY